MAGLEFAKAVYSYSAEGEHLGLPFVVSSIIIYLEDRGDGWSKGGVGVQEGWFPTSYVKKIQLPVCSLVECLFTVDFSSVGATLPSRRSVSRRQCKPSQNCRSSARNITCMH
jgi:hypothetical protein